MLGVHVRLVGMVGLLSINSGIASGRGNACDALFGTNRARFAGGTKAGSADWMLGGLLRCRAANEPAKGLVKETMLVNVEFEMILRDIVVEVMS